LVDIPRKIIENGERQRQIVVEGDRAILDSRYECVMWKLIMFCIS